MNVEPLRIGIVGLGTVGQGTLKLLREKKAEIESAAGRPIEVVAVSVQNPEKEREVSIGNIPIHENALALAADPKVEVVLELMGGTTDAKAVIECAIAHGKDVITANKALLAEHGVALANAAEAQGTMLAFEGSVGGELPIIAGIRRLKDEHIRSVSGIVNGSTNYILTRMGEGMSFADALTKAQQLGYAEADPSFDVDGIDAAQKLGILSALAFGVDPSIATIEKEGISNITPDDIQQAAARGNVIKLVASASVDENGVLTQRVAPQEVPKNSPLGETMEAKNAIVVKSDRGEESFQGRGAGGEATGNAVVADIVALAKGERYLPFGCAASQLGKTTAVPQAPTSTKICSSSYFQVVKFDANAVANAL